MFISKKYKDNLSKYDSSKEYHLGEAIDILHSFNHSKFDESVDISINLGVDPKHADQLIRGTVSLPNGTGKKVKVIVVARDDEKNKKAKELGLEAMEASVYADDLISNIELNDVGYLMALTGNAEINNYALDKFEAQFGENGSFRLISPEEMNNPQKNPRQGLFSHTDDYIKLTDVARKYPAIQEIDIDTKEQFEGLIEMTKSEKDMVPLFIKKADGQIDILSSFSKDVNVENFEGHKLVYLGKPIDVEQLADSTTAMEDEDNSM